MQDNLLNSQRRALRSVNNCNKIANLFKNQKLKNLCENIQFVPKHILKKVTSKQQIICQDINQANFTPNKASVDIFTMRTATKIQQKYKNSIKQFKLKNLSTQSLSQSQANPNNYSIDNQYKNQNFTSLFTIFNEQNVKRQIPTRRSIH